MSAKTIVRPLFALAMVAIGVTHFTGPEAFVRIVPAWLPAPLALVYISGAAEIAGGVGLLVPKLRRAASYGLVALYVAVFPANVNMAVNAIPLGNVEMPAWAPWVRLPFQIAFIALALWVGRAASPKGAEGAKTKA